MYVCVFIYAYACMCPPIFKKRVLHFPSIFTESIGKDKPVQTERVREAEGLDFC